MASKTNSTSNSGSSRLKVVLINAPPLAIVEPWYDRPNWGRVGLAYLAAKLRQHPGFDVSIIDAKLERLDFQQTLARVTALQPHVVGLTAFTNEIKPAAYLAALIKEENPSLLTVIGGVHVTALPIQTLEEFASFDVGVVGEGEITFLELCEAVRADNDMDGIPGLAYRREGGFVQTELRKRILDQDEIPQPAWDLLPPSPEYWVQTLRGCPFNCVFCMNHNGRVARTRSVENVIEEIESIIDTYKPKTIRFGDELFTVNMDRSRKMMGAMIARGIGGKVQWDCQTHVRFVDYELLVQMKEAGCYQVDLGIETGDESALKSLGKGTNLSMIHKAAEAAKKAKLAFGTFFIIGQPNETRESIKNTIDLAVKLNPNLPMIGLMCPYPATEVSRLAANGEAGYRLISTDWDEYNKQIGGAMEFANLTRSQIEWIQILAYTKVFLYNLRFFDFLKFTWEYRKGAWSVLKKAITRRSMSSSLVKPSDYDEKLRGGRPASMRDIIEARSSWGLVQKSELTRTHKEAPELLKIARTS
ncbi:MAG: radical SAM protein [Pirellulaceae bacterium]|nr:radical SAM protein [Planctomycetaceae bacterium]